MSKQIEYVGGQIYWSPEATDFTMAAKAVQYHDVREVFNKSGRADFYFTETDEVLSLWKMQDERKKETHIAILYSAVSGADEAGRHWCICEEQQWYLYDEEKAVIEYVSRLHQDDWKKFEDTPPLFEDRKQA